MVSIITIDYNTTHFTIDLLRSIERLNNASVEVVVVDNGSKVNPKGRLLEEFPWITFVRSETNLGFAGGNNLGMKVASGEYFFFINNDTEFSGDILPRMVALLEQNPSVGILCPVIHYFQLPQHIQYAGFTAMNPYTGRNRCLTEIDSSSDNGINYTHFAHGAAMLIPKLVVETVGMMDENYFLYYEELDWSQSIKKAGFTIAVDTQSSLFHKESQSVGEGELKSYLMARNRILYMRKFSKPFQLITFWLFFLGIASPWYIFQCVVKRKYSHIRAFMEGVFWNLKFPVASPIIGYKFNHLRYNYEQV
jgi:GT2 family glycosyltransferase